MRKYATISVPIEIKKALEEAKGKDEWGNFLLNLYKEAKRSKGKRAFKHLASIITPEELSDIIKSSEEFRRGFSFR